MKRLILLGASGSIGRQTCDVIAHHPADFSLIAFSVGHHTETIADLLKSHPEVRAVCVGQTDAMVQNLKHQSPDVRWYEGDAGLLALIRENPADLVVNALVGFVGFEPTIAALTQGIDVALANKESLVVGGAIIRRILDHTSVRLWPIDSEHVALAKCLEGHEPSTISRLILTASGGSFRQLTRAQLAGVTVTDALKHPSWSMGPKITIDSATMMNKGFELIEAHYLFGLPMDKIDVLMHDESHIHSLVEFVDGSFLADIGPADMRIPISYALFAGTRVAPAPSRLALRDFGTWHFKPFDPERYPAVALARRSMAVGGTMPTTLNAANEVAVHAFLEGKIPFIAIEGLITDAMDHIPVIADPTVENIVASDLKTRNYVHQRVEELHS